MADIANPHDKFFKEVLSREEIARDFMIHYLPSDVVDLFDMTSLEIRKDSFVDNTLKEYFSDLLYCVDTKDGGSSYVYVLGCNTKKLYRRAQIEGRTHRSAPTEILRIKRLGE